MNSFQAYDFTYPKDKRTGQDGVVSPGETKMTLSQNSMGLIIRMLLCMMKGSHPSSKDEWRTVLNTELPDKEDHSLSLPAFIFSRDWSADFPKAVCGNGKEYNQMIVLI